MTDRIPPKRFHEIGWRVVRDDVSTRFHTGTFAASLSLAEAIGRLAEGGSQRPDLDLRSEWVTVRLRCDTEGRFSEDDLTLAERISTMARDLGASVDLTGLQAVQVAIDALVIPEVMPFWRAVLGYGQRGEDLEDDHNQGPPFWFQQMDAPRPQRNRIHIDLFVPHDQAEARVAAAIAAGGHIVSDENAPKTWLLADAEGNEVDVASWPDLG